MFRGQNVTTKRGEIFHGITSSRNNGEVSITEPPKGLPVLELPDMPNEYASSIIDMNK